VTYDEQVNDYKFRVTILKIIAFVVSGFALTMVGYISYSSYGFFFQSESINPGLIIGAVFISFVATAGRGRLEKDIVSLTKMISDLHMANDKCVVSFRITDFEDFKSRIKSLNETGNFTPVLHTIIFKRRFNDGKYDTWFVDEIKTEVKSR
jgi:hypothetical protein